MLLRSSVSSSSRALSRRSISTESSVSTLRSDPPPPSPPQKTPRPKFSPAPRTATSNGAAVIRRSTNPRASSPSPIALPYLFPPNFGQNQVLSVPDSTRALLEEITRSFDAPIRYAFAYGSGVFKQEGHSSNSPKPMLDFVFAVNHPSHWHSININQHPSHYPSHARLFGSEFISRVQRASPGLWFNTYVPMSGVMIKYGVTTVDNLCSDLLSWNTLYLSGRMHKPIRIIRDDARVRLTQQVNLVSALRTALLALPSNFDEHVLFERMAGFSYAGDPRMLVPAENRSKVSNIVTAQSPQFRELYQRLANGLPGVHWPAGSSSIEQDTSTRARGALLRKLPSNLFHRLEQHYTKEFTNSNVDFSSYENDPQAFWSKVGAEEGLGNVIDSELVGIVRWPATRQSIKGVLSTGLGKSIKYGASKVGKWWRS